MAYQAKVYKKQGGGELVVADGGKITIESGGTVEAQSGSIMTLPDIALEIGDLALEEGSIIVGNNAGKAIPLSAKTTTRILVGNGTTISSVVVSNDATLTNSGALTITNLAVSAAKLATDAVTTAKILDGNVTSAKLAAGAGVAALLTAGLGGSHSVLKTETETHTVVAAHATKDRACLVLVVVDETYAIGTGTLPTVKIGETDAIEKAMAATVLDTEVAGTVLAFAFTNIATKTIIITTTAADGNSTGGCSVTVLAIPTT